MSTQQNPIVFINGLNLYLRPVEMSDLERMQRWVNDPEVRKFLKVFMPLNTEGEKGYIEQMTNNKDSVTFAIVTKEGNQHIGNIALHRINWKDRIATTGTVIGEKAMWGKGYGTEAKLLLLRYAFDTLNLHKISSLVYDFNIRSLAYAKKCGYVQEGLLRQQIFRDGKYCDIVQLGVLQEEFAEAWANHPLGRAEHNV